MNIRVTPFSFTGRIIDAHAHLGVHEGQTYTKNNLDVFVKSDLPNNDTVERILVSDIDVLHSAKDEYTGNLNTKSILENDPKYALMASCSPKDGNVENIKRLFNENPDSFIALKFHPTIQQLELTNPKYEPYLEFADKNKLPCLFHTAVLTDNSGKLTQEIEKYGDPELIYNIAKKHKDTPMVMAHLGAGWNEAHDKAINVLVQSIKNGDANLYADISWVDIDAAPQNGRSAKEHILKAIKRLKGIGDSNWIYGDQSYRLIFGSDIPLARFHSDTNPNALANYTKFIDDIKFAIKNDNDLCSNAEKIIEDIFYNNAKKLYFPEKQTTIPASPVRATRSTKQIALITGGIIAGLSFAGYIIQKLISHKDEAS